MSGFSSLLEACNNPALVASAGVVTLRLLPLLERSCISSATPWLAVKGANALLYALNVYATSQPGRLDGASSSSSSSKKQKNNSKQRAAQTIGPRGQTLLAPAGWAFAIWGPIFLGELIACLCALFVYEQPPTSTASNSHTIRILVPTLRRASAGFQMAQVCQILWTAAFRPKYLTNQHPAPLFLSAGLLGATAVCLNCSHLAITTAFAVADPNGNTNSMGRIGSYLLFLFPLSLHFGWISAASLVNLNGSLALFLNTQKQPDVVAASGRTARLLAAAGNVSAVAAAVVGVTVTLSRQAPMYGAVLAWALTACANTMQQRRRQHDIGNSNSKLSLLRPRFLPPFIQRGIERLQRAAAGRTTATGTSTKEQQPQRVLVPGLYGARVQQWICTAGAMLCAAASVKTVFWSNPSSSLPWGSEALSAM